MVEQQKHIDIWNACLNIIESCIEAQKFQTWFKPVRPVSIVGSTLTVEVPSDFFREFLEETYLDIIAKTLKRVIGNDARLVYQIRPVTTSQPMRVPAQTTPIPENRTTTISVVQPGSNPGPFVYPGITRIKVNPRLKTAYSFENLVSGECNRMGITAGESISNAPGNNPFNPLFIFGGPGLGKTHLAQAIGLAVHKKSPELIVLYVTGNEFKTQYMEAVTVHNKLTDFINFYQKIDVLIVDDIHELIGAGSQGAFFNVFNHLHQSGKQLILTSDRAPVDLQNFEERLLSRFKWGLSVELGRPDFQTRVEMLRSRCFREGVQLSDDVIEYLASRIKTNFRELEGTLISLIAHATLDKREITIDLARQITEKLVGEEQSDVTIDKVQKVVCEYFGITRDALLSKTRKRQIVQARQIAMYMSRNLITNCSLSTIGSEIGGKDHATVLHACSTVNDLIETDKSFRQYVTDIEKILVPAGK